MTHNLCKNKAKTSHQNNAVYEIPCKNCKKIYVGESGRDLKIRIKEHKTNITNVKEKKTHCLSMWKSLTTQ